MPIISDLVRDLNRLSKGNLHEVGRGPQHQLNRTEKKEVLERQNYLCAGGNRCQKRHGKVLDLNIDNCQFDHIKPRALGGSNTMNNMQALCPNCHAEKTKEDLKRIHKKK